MARCTEGRVYGCGEGSRKKLHKRYHASRGRNLKEQDQPHYRTRVKEGEQAVEFSTDGERAEILKKFKEAMRGESVKERKKKLTETAELVTYGTEVLDGEEGSQREGSGPSNVSPPALDQAGQDTKETSDPEASERLFERDLELAKRLSLYEQ
ncbi:hypothetical protein GYMLUDRAFT_498995 [Collybiopsis luxurians FD-317 M1]|uniref:Uncharacterized protein n=1 Tax=Collybiopsis luxurians FD-317 M1 TaxID=944289 RepID=A0A0D0C2T4_9AGAR|nr:hypothetical protein GYMLUDRAFT_498995 [Collybiopsis luxurians FD-317 M1]